MTDEQIHRLLRETPADVRLPDGFGREVWARIEAAEVPGLGACMRRWWDELFAGLERPLVAAVTIALFLMLGTVLGGWHAARSHAVGGELAYLESISPLLQSMREDVP